MGENRNGLEPYEGREDYIFISYAHSDTHLVFPVLRKMKEEGYRFWYDDGIEPGSEWPESIAHHLADSKVCMAFMSPASANSRNCRREIHYALAKEKEFMSIVLEPVDLTPGLEMQISAYQSIEYFKNPDPDDVMRRIRRIDILESCRQKKAAAKVKPGIDWIENPLPVEGAPQTDVQEQQAFSGWEGSPGEEARTKQPAETAAETHPETESMDPAKESAEEIKEIKKNRKNSLKAAKKERKAGKKGTDGEENRKKKKFRPAFVLVPLLAIVICAVLFVLKPFAPRLKIDDKVFKDDTSYQSFDSVVFSGGDMRTLSRFKKCQTLILRRCDLPAESMDQIAKMSGLRTLTLTDCKGVENLKPLAALTELRSLTVSDCGLTDEMLSDFTGSGNIRTLILDENELTKIPVIAGADVVTELSARDNQVADISWSKKYTGLERLNLSGNPIGDISQLALPEKISAVFIARTGMKDMGIFNNSLYLKTLDVSENEITDISPLQNSTRLENVDISGNSGVKDISVLKKSAGTLKRLNVSGIAFSSNEESAQVVSDCNGLTVLGLAGCSIEDTSFLEVLPHLSWLDLSDNQIAKVAGLSSMKELDFINLSNNELTDMTGLPVINDTGWPGRYILLHGNQISELFKYTGSDVAVLDVSANPVTDFGPFKDVTVRNLIFDVTGDTDLPSVKSEDYTRTYYVTSIPADRRVDFEEKVSSNGKFMDWQEALQACAADKMAFALTD